MKQTIQFYQGPAYECAYLNDQLATNIYPDPDIPMTNDLYGQLIQHGFRRSGDHAYRPFCGQCDACVPVRINVRNFQPNRSQRRCLQRNQEIQLVSCPAKFKQEHYDLYRRYQTARHPGGGMDTSTEEIYLNFLTSAWSNTRFIEFRLEQQLLGVAVTDFVANGGSAFYTFFEPEAHKRSIGTYAILQQIAVIQSLKMNWLYLGYWIEDCQKMRYKTDFSALEAYVNRQWQPLSKQKTL